MPGKFMKFGFGTGLIIVLTVLLLYGIYVVFAERNQNVLQDQSIQEALTVANKGQARFVNIFGEEIGTARLQEDGSGILIRLELANLPPGYHAIHIHEAGNCTPVGARDTVDKESYFTNAGPHLKPNNKEHGLLNIDGPHAGDLENLYVHEDGTVKAQLFTDRVTLQQNNDRGLGNLLDSNGTALIIHDGEDDYTSPDTGRAGTRIACAVIEPA